MSEASLGIWKRIAPSAPALPCMKSLNQMTKQTVTCVGTCSHTDSRLSPTPLLPILRMADPGVDSNLSWTQSLMLGMDASWEAPSAAVPGSAG